MKKIPMILLILTPYIILILNFTSADITIPLYVYGGILAFNLIYAFLLPRLGFEGKQLLFWNLMLKLFNTVIVLFLMLFTLIIMLASGEGGNRAFAEIFKIVLAAFYVLQVSAAVFSLSGFLQYRKQGIVATKAVVGSTIVQLIPIAALIGSFSNFFSLRNKTAPIETVYSTTEQY